MTDAEKSVLDALKKAKKVAIFCHTRPDGDALGGILALQLALENEGKTARAFCDEPPAEKFSFLPAMQKVKTTYSDCGFDLMVAIDCADVTRLGVFAGAFRKFKGATLNIDHHISNTKYAKENFVCECPASCQILTNLLSDGGFEITEEIANLLALGLITDSGNFTHSDVTEETFRCAARLKACGADFNKINYETYSRQPRARADLYGRVMSKIRYEHDGRFAYIVITQKDMTETGADKSLTEGFVDFPLSVDGVEVSAAIMEFKENQYKVSLRSKGKVNVNSIASSFGGGGHVLASGCMLFGSLEEVIDKLTYAVYQNL